MSGPREAAPQIVALCGLAGAGKTSVALEYAYRHLAEVGIAWELPAEDPEILAAGFGELAAQLGAREVLDARAPVAAVHAVLAAFPADWLLVLDNAPDRASVARFVPPAGRGRVLITSQSGLWPPGQGLEVPVLAVDVAAGFLVSRTGDPDEHAAAQLASALGGLPLALEQAAAYMQATGSDLSAYLASFRRRRADLLARGDPAGYSKTVAATWTLALERLQRTDPAAVGLLRLLAFCAPDAVPLRLLLQPRATVAERLVPQVAPVLEALLEDELAAADAIAALRRYSLTSPPASGLISVHRIVQAVTVDQMTGELAAQWRQAASELIEAAIPDDPAEPEAWPACALLLPHARIALPAGSAGMTLIADYLGHSGSYAAARDLFREASEARTRVLGAGHPETLAARARLARWTGKAGDAAAARDQFAALLPLIEEASGEEDPKALAARANLARFTGEAGDVAGARDQYAELLPAVERVFGPDNSETLSDRANLARFTGEAGDVAGARDRFASLLPVHEGILGPEHPKTLLTRASLAHWTGLAGDPAAARDQYAALLPLRQQVLGPEHPDTLTTLNNLAHWTGEAGDPAAARDQLTRLLLMRERVLGPEHPDTLITRNNLARWTGETGDPAAARDQYAALLSVRQRVLGPEHPRTLFTRGRLATWAGEAGDPDAARDQYAALLPVIERVLGPQHPDTLITWDEAARWTGQAGDPGAARDQYAALLPVIERVLGPEHPQTRNVRDNLDYWTAKARR